MAQPTSTNVAPTPPTQPQQSILLTSTQNSKFEEGLTLILNTWPALTLAVQNEFGGPESADKRDWMCGAVAELFESTPGTITEDLEQFLLEILADEFETALEDDSAYSTAQKILLLRSQVSQNDFSAITVLQDLWEKLGKGAQRIPVVQTEIGTDPVDGDEEDGDDDDEDEDGEDEDEMDIDTEKREDEAPELVAVKEKVDKVVDEDGFELVQSRRRKK